MPDNDITGKITLIIQADTTQATGAASGAGSSSARATATAGRSNQNTAPTAAQKRTEQFYTKIDKGIGTVVKGFAAGGIITVLAQYSKLAAQVLGVVGDIIGAIVDVFLMPFMPLFAKIFEKLAPLIPVLMELFDDLVTPLVDLIVPIIKVLGPMILEVAKILGPLIKSIGMTVALLTAPFFKSIEVGILLLTKILTPLADFMDAWNKKFSGPAPTTDSSGLGLTTGGSRPTASSGLGLTTGGSRPTSTTGYAIPNGLNLLGKRLGGEVSRDGMYYLHRGENVQTSTKSSDAPIVFNISNNLEIGSVADINYLVSMLEKSITDKLTTISRRTA